MPNTRVLICDLDNTLYDWVAFFVASFYAMVDEAVTLVGCDKDELLDSLREVHRRWNDSEHPFALLESKIVQARFPGKSRSELKSILDSAFHKFNSVRKCQLKEYPGVKLALQEIEASGTLIVGHTESNAFAAGFRLKRLNLIEHFSKVYCREKAGDPHPSLIDADSRTSFIEDPKLHQLARHRRKPDPDVLREILDEFDLPPDQAVYVGDSLTRDIKMAAEVGVPSIWAKYGNSHPAGSYEKLVRVTHWTDDDVARERALRKTIDLIKPDYVAENGFFEVPGILKAIRQRRVPATA